MHDYISGIQQIGIGVSDLRPSMLAYKEIFGMDVLVFDDTSDAKLMTAYTGGEVYTRRAVLSLNMRGGGGFEIWQFKSRKPSEPHVAPSYGDLGIYAAKIKCADPAKLHNWYAARQDLRVSTLQTDAKGDQQFWVTDQYNNTFQLVAANHWFRKNGSGTGGVSGAVIGVTNMEVSIAFYRGVLGIDELVYDVTEPLPDMPADPTELYRKVLLRKQATGKGAFGKLLGSIEIELVQSLNRTPLKIFANRYWGDCGFIHLCFDVLNMVALKQHAEKNGCNFTVDSIGSFDMQNASGRFCYLEDPDGTLIELVETHKVPIMKKLGWYLDLKKRTLEKPLPDWMINMLSISKVK